MRWSIMTFSNILIVGLMKTKQENLLEIFLFEVEDVDLT